MKKPKTKKPAKPLTTKAWQKTMIPYQEFAKDRRRQLYNKAWQRQDERLERPDDRMLFSNEVERQIGHEWQELKKSLQKKKRRS